MYRALLHLRRPLTFAATLLLAVAYWHCAWEWAAELKHHSAIQFLPGAPAQGCDNESGCICQGATLAHAASAECLAADDLRWQLAGLAVAAIGGDIFDCDVGQRIPAAERAAPPISGRQLRALYASLLI